VRAAVGPEIPYFDSARLVTRNQFALVRMNNYIVDCGSMVKVSLNGRGSVGGNEHHEDSDEMNRKVWRWD
jgi:hypothetical protein